MQPSSRALIWYFWRLSRASIGLLVVISAITMSLIAAGRGNAAAPAYAYMNLCVQVFFIVAFGGLLSIQGRGRAFVPAPYLMSLPLPTGRYVAGLHGYVIVVMGIVSCAVTAVHLRVFGNVIESFGEVTLGFWQIPLVCVCLVCMVQSVLHLSGIRNELLFVPLGLAMLVMAFVVALPVLDPGNIEKRSLERPALVALCFAWACSYGAIAAYRCGRWESVVPRLMSAIDRGHGRTRTFATADRALFWLGWRRHGRIFLMGTLLFCLLSLVFGLADMTHCDSAGLHIIPQAFERLVLFAGIPIFLSGAFLCAGVALFRDNDDFYKTGRAYFLTLPVRSVAMARGRLLAMAFSLIVASTLAAAGFVSLFRLAWPDLSVETPHVALTFLAASAAAWVAMWFGPILLAAVIVGDVVSLLFSCVQGNDVFVTTVAILVVPIAVATVLAASYRRGVLDRANVVLMALVSIPPVCACAVLVPGMSANPLPFCAGMLLIPLPFAAVPLALDWYRHG